MGDTLSSLGRKALRVLNEEGWRSLYGKTKRRIGLYRHQKSLGEGRKAFMPGERMDHPDDMAEKWLKNNRDNCSNTFYILLKFVTSLNAQLKDVAHVSCDAYVHYFKERCVANQFPFEIPFGPVGKRENIIEFMNEFDYAYLDKMIRGVFISLIRFLISERGRIDLLDFGTGATCGMYGENGRFLFEQGKVSPEAVHFVGIDDLHDPQGSIFEKAAYHRCNILSFATDRKFDLITGHHVLEHCCNWDEVMAHVSKLLKQKGYFYLSFPRFGGFYDSVYRLMSPFDHCATFDIDMLKNFAKSSGLEMCFSDVYVDPNNRFDWICALYPDLAHKEIADCFYHLCVQIDAKLLLGCHHYGHYVVFRKIGNEVHRWSRC
jgi:SAM-dependent methyltransferase